MDMENLNNLLNIGVLPRELNYITRTPARIDYNKLQYNSRYQSYDYYGAKFPRGWSDSPLFSPLIESIANKAKLNNITPLQELDELNKISNKYIDDTNTSE